MRSKLNILSVFFLLMLLIASCKSKEQLTISPAELEPLTQMQLLDSLTTVLPSYTTMSFRARVNVTTASENQNFTVNLRSQNDSIVWATITGPLGYEAARVILTSDSIKIIDRLNRQFVQRPFSFIEHYIPISANLDLITKLLVGDFFIKDDRGGRWENTIDERFYRLSYKSNILEAYYWLHPVNFTIHQANIIDLVGNRLMLVKLDDYRKIDDRWIPFERILEFPGENATMKISLNRISLGDSFTYPFNVSDNYERVE